MKKDRATILVGLTGGIGAGKTYCADLFRELGIPIYPSDERAKSLMVNDPEVIKAITIAFGKEAYLPDGKLHRSHIANQIFSDNELRNTINNIVHPAVRADFLRWVTRQQEVPYVIQESALLFEIGLHATFDAMILVDAPVEVRIKRVIARDGNTRQQVLDRINSQMPSDEKRPLATYIIDNDGERGLVKQVLSVHRSLRNL